MAKEIGTDEICEIASIITEEICIAKGIQIDQKQDNEDINYTDEAQDIFNKYFDLLDNTFRD